MHQSTLLVTLSTLLLAVSIAFAQPADWSVDEDNVIEGWVFAGAEEVTKFQLPDDDETALSFSVGCIPYYEPTCCAAWSDSNWVIFSGMYRDEDADANSLMFGGIYTYMENYDGEQLMYGGILEDFIGPVTVTASYDPSILEDNYMVPEGYYVMYYNPWNGLWRETNLDWEFDYDNHTVTLTGYEVHAYLGFFARSFYNRPPKFIDVPTELTTTEGDVEWFDISYTDPDDVFDAFLEVDPGDYTGTLLFYENEVGEGELVLNTNPGEAGEYFAKLLLTDDEGETAEHELHIVINANLSVEEAESELLPQKTALMANYPNPFNPSTTLNFSLDRSSVATLEVFDIRGVKVASLLNSELPAGIHSVTWDLNNPTGVSAGNYIVRLQAGDVKQQRMIQYIR